MFCNNCGNKIDGNPRFCLNCGAVIGNGQTEFKAPTPALSGVTQVKNPLSSKLKILIPIAAVVFVALIVVIIVFSSTKDERKFKKALEEADAYTLKTMYMDVCNNPSKIDEKKKYDSYIHKCLEDYYSKLCDLTFDDNATEAEMNTALKDFQNENGFTVIGDIIDDFFENYLSQTDYELLNSIFDMDSSKTAYIQSAKTLADAQGSAEDYIFTISRLNIIETSDKLYPKAQEMLEKATKLYFDAVSAKAESFMQKDDYSSALKVFEQAKSSLPDNDSVISKYNELTLTVAAKYAEKAETEFSVGDINAAIGNIEAALGFSPDNGDYKVKLEKYKQYIPLNLCKEKNVLSLTKIDKYTVDVLFEETLTSNTGEKYENGIRCMPNSSDTKFAEAKYNLAGNYDNVSGKIFLEENSKSKNVTGYFEVYGDGKLIFTSEKTGKDILPKDFSFNVTGIQILKIVFCGSCEPYGDGSRYYGIADMTATKTVK